ncbi:hypothetical protein M9H77_02172 [Catharanthus roseus]|uniref:Uncharacterized protein n=1 Tax=Catharanthus roseus TaxID=4058 RepID=A0ACC0C7M2_CATRO|nr:hypothetical protein M9H77_02172 [Catharanthus roseus]
MTPSKFLDDNLHDLNKILLDLKDSDYTFDVWWEHFAYSDLSVRVVYIYGEGFIFSLRLQLFTQFPFFLAYGIVCVMSTFARATRKNTTSGVSSVSFVHSFVLARARWLCSMRITFTMLFCHSLSPPNLLCDDPGLLNVLAFIRAPLDTLPCVMPVILVKLAIFSLAPMLRGKLGPMTRSQRKKVQLQEVNEMLVCIMEALKSKDGEFEAQGSIPSCFPSTQLMRSNQGTNLEQNLAK